MEYNIKLKDIELLVEGAKDLTLNPKAEDSLIALLDLKDKVDELVEQAKSMILDEGRKKYKDLKSITASNLKLSVRYFGDKYDTQDPEFRKEIVSTRVDSTKIEKYLEENGKLPDSVMSKARTEKVVITRI